MKKLITIGMAAALMFATVGQASATALETSGVYRARYWYISNPTMGMDTAADDSMGFWDQRLRLNMAWQVSEGVKVGARADILENDWPTDATNEIDFDQAFASIALGGTPLTIVVGRQDVSWGTGMFAQADNRYRAKLAFKTDAVAGSLAYDQVKESYDDGAVDDAWGASLGATTKLGDLTAGVLGWYSSDKSTADLEKRRMGVDVFCKGQVGPANLAAEAAFATGKDDSDVGDDVDASALMAYVGAFMPAGPANVGVEFAYSAGDDATTDENEAAYSQEYQGPFSSFILFNNFDMDGAISSFSGDTGVKNAMAVKASATMAASKELSFMGAVVYAMADETAEGQDDQMGVEVDLLAKYMITENVTAQAGFGYLSAGEYFGEDLDNPWVGTVQFLVAF